MASQWYYLKGEAQHGPVSSQDLKQLAASGQLEPADLIWKEGLADWQPASKLKGLEFPQAAAQPAPVIQAPTVDPLPFSAPAPIAQDTGFPQVASTPQFQTSSPQFGAPQPRARSRGSSKSLMWSGLVIAGSALMILSFCVPWWGLTLRKPSDKEQKEAMEEFRDDPEAANERAEELQDRHRNTEQWLEDHVSKSVERKWEEEMREVTRGDKKSVTFMLWGWNTGGGLMAFIFGLVLTPAVIVLASIRATQRWTWIVHFVAIVPGVLMLVFFAMWFFGAPSANAEPVMRVGLIAGPYVILIAGVLLLIGGITGGISGAMALGGRKQPQGYY